MEDGSAPNEEQVKHGSWDKLKGYFKKDKTDAATVSSSDLISQDQAEFRAAGNQLTSEVKDNALRRQVQRENPGATDEQIDDLVFMKGFKGKDMDPQIAKDPRKTTETALPFDEPDEEKPEEVAVEAQEPELAVEDQEPEDEDVNLINSVMDGTYKGEGEPSKKVDIKVDIEGERPKESIDGEIEIPDFLSNQSYESDKFIYNVSLKDKTVKISEKGEGDNKYEDEQKFDSLQELAKYLEDYKAKKVSKAV